MLLPIAVLRYSFVGEEYHMRMTVSESGQLYHVKLPPSKRFAVKCQSLDCDGSQLEALHTSAARRRLARASTPGHAYSLPHSRNGALPQSIVTSQSGDSLVMVQFVLVAKKMTRTIVTSRQEDVEVAVPKEREPWLLPKSIFAARAKRGPQQCDAKDYFDTPKVLTSMFEQDWARLLGKVRCSTPFPTSMA
jgi:hypothetical protein